MTHFTTEAEHAQTGSQASGSTLEIAFAYWQSGLNLLPCALRSKTPILKAWKQYQAQRQTEAEVTKLFSEHDGNIAVVCGPASGNLGVLDIEDRGLFGEWSQEFEHQVGPTWMVATKRGGHIYFRTARPINGRSHQSQGYEIRGANQMVLAPPSQHPQGGQYEFVDAGATIAYVAALPFCDLDYVVAGAAQEKIPRTRDDRPVGLVQCQEVFERIASRRDRYPSRSEFDQAVVQTLVNMGADFESVLRAFTVARHDTHFGSVARAGHARRAESYLRRGYDKAVSRCQATSYSSGDPDAWQHAQALRAYVNGLPWSLKNSDKPVLLAHITKFEQCLTQPWHLSVREGAEIARVTYMTVSRSNTRLIEGQYIRQEAPARFSEPASYALGPRVLDVLPALLGKFPAVTNTHDERGVGAGVQGDQGVQRDQEVQSNQEVQGVQEDQHIPKAPPTPSHRTDSVGQTDTHGVFETRQGLGKAAEIVWLEVRHSALSQAQVVARTGLSKGTVSKRVKKLCGHGVLIQEGKTYRAVPGFDFRGLAEQLGTAGIGSRRRAIHQEEREDYKARQEESRRIYNDEYKRKVRGRVPLPFGSNASPYWKHRLKKKYGKWRGLSYSARCEAEREFIHDDALGWVASAGTIEYRRVPWESPDELVAWVAGRDSPWMRELHDLVEAAASGVLPMTLRTPGMPNSFSACEFVLDAMYEIRALILVPSRQTDQDAVRFETLVGALRDLRGQWKDSVEVGTPSMGLDDVDVFDADPFADEDFDPFAEADVEHIPNPKVEASLAQAEHIKAALRCSDPACTCHQPGARVHCPVCGRLTLWAGMGAACEVAVGCRRVARQRRNPCEDEEIWDVLESWGLWSEALTKAAQAACRKIWVGPKPPGGGAG